MAESSFGSRSAIASFLVLTSLGVPGAAQSVAVANDHAIRGQIVDALSGQPITDVELALDKSLRELAAEPVAPDSEGRFTFSGLTPGEYTLRAVRPDFGTIYFGELADFGWVQTIRIEPDEHEKVIVFRLIPRGSVTGIVRDEFGDPMVGATVRILRPVWTDGRVVTSSLKQAITDDRGQYKIGGLMPGPYQVCAVHSFGTSLAVPSRNEADFLSPDLPRQHAPACYPDSNGSARAAFPIAAGQRAQINLAFVSAPAARIRGRVVGPSMLGGSIRLVSMDSFDGAESFEYASTDLAKATFEFRAVLPGRYRIEAQIISRIGEREQVPLVARRSVVVGASNLDDIELMPEQGADLEVVFHGAEGVAAKRGDVILTLRPAAPGLLAAPFGEESGNDNSFRFKGLPPGVYWVGTRSGFNGSDDTSCIQSVKLDGQELLHGRLTVTPAMTGRIDVTVLQHCGVIKGRVMSKGKPVPDAKVLLLLSGSAEEPGDMVTGFTSERGEFKFPALPFGSYQLWAWSIDQGAGFFGPANLADEVKLATAVSVMSDEPVAVDLEIVPAEGQPK